MYSHVFPINLGGGTATLGGGVLTLLDVDKKAGGDTCGRRCDAGLRTGSWVPVEEGL